MSSERRQIDRARARRDAAGPRFPFVYRCPMRLIGPLDEARWRLREPSRTSLVTKAIEHYLAAQDVEFPAA